MAFGFSPKHIEELDTQSLTTEEVLTTAVETVKLLNWDLALMSKQGLVAYTSYSMLSQGEEVQVAVDEGKVKIKSVCAGNQLVDWGKNKANINAFIAQFNMLKSDLNPEEVAIKYAALEPDFLNNEDQVMGETPLSQKERMSSVFSLFKPVKGYFVTPILIYLNVAIFVLMAISGVSMMLPSNEDLLLWGANFRPMTLDGGWWRLLSSCFLHIGVLHLLFNMYALLYIGLLLEPYLGRSRFLSAYILTGLVGSVVSVFWHELTISAGASGAIFGMYGVFLAMLTTNLIEKSARKTLLTSIAIFVGYNLLNGLKGGVDNAAHIGGLLSGLVVGYAFYPGLIKPGVAKLKFGVIGVLSLFVLSLSIIVLSTTSLSDLGKYEEAMQEFAVLEEKAMSIYHLPENVSDQRYLHEIEENGIPNWELNLQLLERVDQFDLPTEVHERNAKLKEYCELRISSYRLIYKMITDGTVADQAEVERYNQQIEAIIEELTKS